jgi:hypothetical protein
MNALFQADELSVRKRIAIVAAGVVLLGLALWVGITMGLIMDPGR